MKLATTLLFEASFPFWFESLRVDFAVVLNWKSFDIEVDGVAEIHVVFTELAANKKGAMKLQHVQDLLCRATSVLGPGPSG